MTIRANTPLRALIQRIYLMSSYDIRGAGKAGLWAQSIDLYVYNEHEKPMYS